MIERNPRTLNELIGFAASISAPGSPVPDGGDPDWVGGVIDETDRFTWAQLDARTERVASWLVGQGVTPGDRVGVWLPKSARSFEAVHAVLRAGAVVVPVDPLSPAAVAERVLSDASASALITTEALLAKLDGLTEDPQDGTAPLRLCVDTHVWDAAVHTAPVELPTRQPEDPAYLIYTSGSTGVPKGILHTHRSAMAYATLAVEDHGLQSTDRLAATSPLHFDMSTLELYAVPLAAATAVVMSEAHVRFPASLVERCETERVTVWYAVPFLLQQIVERGALDRRDLSMLRTVVYAGEPYPPSALGRLMEALSHVHVRNAYGPAEVNVVTVHPVLTIPSGSDHDVPIGTPWPGVDIRIVAEDGTDVAGENAGELWVSSPTVMEGYWGRPELTDRVLIARENGPSWYRTGDVVVRDGDVLRFRGRRDHQVKVRGVRLELEAIEAVITAAPDVVAAVVGVADAAGEAPSVVAAVVLRDGTELDERGLRRWCAQRLAPAALPHRFEAHTSFLTTSSGKIDRATVRRELASHNKEAG